MRICSADKANMNRPVPAVERLIAAAALLGAFLVMASIFSPTESPADLPTSEEDQKTTQSDPHAGLFSFGTLETDQYRVEIYGTSDGPRYSVYNTANGEELGVLLSEDQVAEWFEDLQLPVADFSVPDQIMLVPPDLDH